MSRRLRVRDKFTSGEEREKDLPIKFGYLEFRNRLAAGDPALEAKATRTSLEHLFQQIPAIVHYQDAFAVETSLTGIACSTTRARSEPGKSSSR
ncbi:hypothetical protein [Hyphomicrobium sp. MC8b]|uniref:hypothetical protein n=1 Tax=Hyphomicrobium sp. MC8b TaxID=300273 RepID=UPI00391B54C7